MTDGSYASIESIVRKSKPDVVIHLASLFLADHLPSDVEPMLASNLDFPAKLVEAMIRNRVSNFINVGTSWQHYHSRQYRPVCLYAATKQAFEDLLRYYVDAQNLKVTTLKIFDTYGPDDPRKKLVALLKRNLGQKKAIDMSPGQQKIDLVFIDDVVRAFILATVRHLRKKAEPWECFSIHTRRPKSLRAIVSEFEKASGKKLAINWGGRPYRTREVIHPWKGTKWVPGWRPTVPLIDGFRMVLKGS